MNRPPKPPPTAIDATVTFTGCMATAAVLVVTAMSPASGFNSLHMRKPPYLIATEPIRWNAFSMVGVGKEQTRRRRTIVIDNSVSTAMVRFDGNVSKLRRLRSDWNAGAHLLRPDSDVLIIGAGGGRDILVARAYGQRSIWPIEVNPLVVEMANETFAEFTGRPYTAPNVHPIIGDARSFIANSSEEYGIILASLIDTWAASAAGAFALTENLLYTRDAFHDYYDHLTDDGVLSISRWHPLETPRLLATGLAAWRDAGVSDPRRHAMLIVTEPSNLGVQIVILLMKKSPFTPDEVATIEHFAAETGRSVVLTPQAVSDSVVDSR